MSTETISRRKDAQDLDSDETSTRFGDVRTTHYANVIQNIRNLHDASRVVPPNPDRTVSTHQHPATDIAPPAVESEPSATEPATPRQLSYTEQTEVRDALNSYNDKVLAGLPRHRALDTDENEHRTHIEPVKSHGRHVLDKALSGRNRELLRQPAIERAYGPSTAHTTRSEIVNTDVIFDSELGHVDELNRRLKTRREIRSEEKAKDQRYPRLISKLARNAIRLLDRFA